MSARASRILPAGAEVLGSFRCHRGWLARRLLDGRVLVVGPGGEAIASPEPCHALTTAAITQGITWLGAATRAIFRPHSAIVIRHPPHRQRVARVLLRNVPADRPTITLDQETLGDCTPTLVVDTQHETALMPALARLGVLDAVLDLHTTESGRLHPDLVETLRREGVTWVEGALRSTNWLLDLERSEHHRRKGHVARIARAIGRSVSESTDPG